MKHMWCQNLMMNVVLVMFINQLKSILDKYSFGLVNTPQNTQKDTTVGNLNPNHLVDNFIDHRESLRISDLLNSMQLFMICFFSCLFYHY